MMTNVRLDPRKRPDRVCLFFIASGQAGYFTAQQAHGCGFSRALLSHHVKSGRFIHIRRGLYRFSEYPSSSREHVLAAWLAVGKDVAVVSHESALDLLDLSDIIPDAVHLTVPRSRRSVPSVWGVKIHTTERPIARSERWEREGVAITSPTRSILDAAEKGAGLEQIELAVVQAVERGLASTEELRRAASDRSRRVAELIDGALRKVTA
ncbi:MAG: type IV toxin-antitoxin system AbiEi family antitoxin domain-containing protein [Chloroflexi bacterium]|nr:type IV toxin-antitoxin system AbiEi family antitoxin domain-containing protein [Chloroflexota bacterium]MCL5108070.1 type IV toxin-antitoxin system AbiEi family antitoxin domain-containing protein [Chloroflexota bacterium]